jgi:hypothetical protein
MHASDPPRLATWLVRRCCVEGQLEELEGDLLELYERRVRCDGRAHAAARYWRDALGACVRHRRPRPVLRRTLLWVASFTVAIAAGAWTDRPLYLIPMGAFFFYIDYALAGPRAFNAVAGIARALGPGGGRATSAACSDSVWRGIATLETALLLLLGALNRRLVLAPLFVELVRLLLKGAGSRQAPLQPWVLIFSAVIAGLGAVLGLKIALACIALEVVRRTLVDWRSRRRPGEHRG